MTFQHRELIGVATHLSPNSEERFSRSVVNRAYYAVYGEARALARRHGWQYVKRAGGTHQQVWDYLRSGARLVVNYERALMKSIADEGLALRDKRTKADYLDGAVAKAEADAVLTRARALVARIINAP